MSEHDEIISEIRRLLAENDMSYLMAHSLAHMDTEVAASPPYHHTPAQLEAAHQIRDLAERLKAQPVPAYWFEPVESCIPRQQWFVGEWWVKRIAGGSSFIPSPAPGVIPSGLEPHFTVARGVRLVAIFERSVDAVEYAQWRKWREERGDDDTDLLSGPPRAGAKCQQGGNRRPRYISRDYEPILRRRGLLPRFRRTFGN